MLSQSSIKIGIIFIRGTLQFKFYKNGNYSSDQILHKAKFFLEWLQESDMEEAFSLENYEKLLKEANLLEIKEKQKSLLMLRELADLIEADESVFLEMYPKRKHDLRTLQGRIGMVKRKIYEGAKSSKKLKEAVLTSIQDDFRQADKKVRLYKFGEAYQIIEKTLKQVKKYNIDEQKDNILAKRAEIEAQEQDYLQKSQEIEDFLARAEGKPSSDPSAFLQEAQHMRTEARQIRQDELAAKILAVIGMVNANLEQFEKVKLSIDELRKEAKDYLEKADPKNALLKFQEILDKLTSA